MFSDWKKILGCNLTEISSVVFRRWQWLLVHYQTVHLERIWCRLTHTCNIKWTEALRLQFLFLLGYLLRAGWKIKLRRERKSIDCPLDYRSQLIKQLLIKIWLCVFSVLHVKRIETRIRIFFRKSWLFILIREFLWLDFCFTMELLQ